MKNRKFFIYVFVILTIFIIASVVFYYLQRKELIIEEANIELKAIASEKIKQITEWRHDKFSDASVIANDGIFTKFIDNYQNTKSPVDSIHLSKWVIEYKKNKDYYRIKVLDTTLTCITCDSNIYIPDEQLLRDVLKEGKPKFSDFYRGSDGSIFIDVYAPMILREPQMYKVVGLVILRVDPAKELYPVVQSWPTPSKSSELLIFKTEKDSFTYLNTLRHSKNPPLSIHHSIYQKHLPAAMAARGIRGIVQGKDYRGVPVLADLSDVPETPWIAVTKIDLNEVYEPLDELLWYVLVFGTVLVLISALLTAFLWKTQNAVLYKKLYHSESEKRALVKNFEYLTKYANDIILLLDDKGNIIYTNEKTCDLYGYSPEELQKMNIADLRVNSNVPNTEVIFEQTRQHSGLVYEAMHQKKDGSIIPVESSSRFINIDGINYFQSIIRDVSDKKLADYELKNALKEKEVLLKEVHHRVKNNLQTIISLLSLQANANDDEKVKKILLDSQNRINSMALIHQQLYTDNIAEVDSCKYLKNLLYHLIESFNPDTEKIKVNSNLESHMLSIDIIIPLGLMLNEILSNIFKHAFPDNRTGKIDVEFKKLDTEEYLLQISDNGIGLPEDFEFRKANSLGMQLIHVLTEQIKGNIEIKNHEGTKFIITFKQ